MAALSLLAPFESLLNRNIAASTPARAQLQSIAGKSFAIEVGVAGHLPLLRLRLLAGAAGVSITSGDEPADAVVSGTPLALLALLADRAAGRSGASGVAIRGDAEIAQSFEQLVRRARPDLEEELARFVGDTPAHFAARTARNVLGWAGRARDSLARDIGEYLTEESRDLVPGAELEPLLEGIDRMREDVDRATARLELLERRLGDGARSP